MNKEQLIEKLEYRRKTFEHVFPTKHAYSIAIELAEQLDEPQEQPKIVAPKEFDEWYQEIKEKYSRPGSARRFALWKLSQKGFGRHFENANHEEVDYESKLGVWVRKNQELAIDAIFYGYEVEEPLYRVKIPMFEWNEESAESAELKTAFVYLIHNVTSDETRISYDGNAFGNWKIKLTESQIKTIDERFWAFAVPVEE
ncbi:DUF1642 domain-containing protein [Enterococcus olivae]